MSVPPRPEDHAGKRGGLVLRGSVLRGVMLFANVAAALYLMPLVIHAIGDRWYGMWTLIGTVMGYYGYLDFGLSVATQRFLAGAIGRRDADEINRLFTTALVPLLALGAVAGVVTLGIASSASAFFTDPVEIDTFRTVLLILAANVVVTLVSAPVNGLLTGSLRYDVATYIELPKLVVRTGLIIYFIEAGYSIIALALITFLTDTGGNLVKFLFVRRAFTGLRIGRQFFARDRVKALFAYGGNTFVDQIADLLRFQMAHLIIAMFINLSAVTVFNIATQLVSYYRTLIGAMMGVLAPLYAQYQATENREAVYRTYFFTSKLAAMVATMIGGAIVILGRDFIVFWMGADYVEAYALIAIMVVPTSLFVAQSPAINLIYGLGAVGTIARVSLVEAIANLGISVLLAGHLGLMGVAIGTAVPLTFYALFLMVFASRLAGGSFAIYLRQVLPVYGMGVALQVLAWYLAGHFEMKGYLDLFLFAAAVYPAQLLVMFYILFPPTEKQAILRTSLRAMGLGRLAGERA